MALYVKGDIDAAIPKLSESLNDDFLDEQVMFCLGACLFAKGMRGLSAALNTYASQIRHAKSGQVFTEAELNLGHAYKEEQRHALAEKIWTNALKHVTDRKERALFNASLSGLYVQANNPEKAIHYCDLALKDNPDDPKILVNRGMACLEMRRWREGWFGLSHVFAAGDAPKRNYKGLPDWDGSPNKTVIVWGNQGVGDEIFFAQCLPDMQRVCKRVILDCHPRLPALFARSFPEIEVHGTRKNLTDMDWLDGCGADAAICLSDLMMFFRNSDDEFGDGRPYLKFDWPEPLSELVKLENGLVPLRIGVSWTGGTKRTRTDLRSLKLEELVPVFQARPDAHWFSLQYTENGAKQLNAAKEVCELEERTGIRISHFPGWVECFDYDRTASFVASLDLVISVGTTVHHLAGALGVPVWTLVPAKPGWRYQLEAEALPWYASARLFRQEVDGDWSHPVRRIADELRAGFD